MHREGSLCGPLPVEPGLCGHLCVMASQPEVPQPWCVELLLGPCFIGMTNCPRGISVRKSPAAGPGAHTLHHLVTASGSRLQTVADHSQELKTKTGPLQGQS